ncbi:MAG: hypothetical protein KGI71_03855, partial [Patescibacteria group bacterium]|nr:hypothetical protein [Patescibacteria group bacterium]
MRASFTFERIITGVIGGAFALRAFDSERPWFIRVGYALVGYDLIESAWTAKPLFGGGGPMSDGKSGLGLAREAARADAGLPAGGANRPLVPLTFKETRVKSLQERVGLIHEQMVKDTRDPKVYALAREVLTRKCGDAWCVPAKDYEAESTALFNEVRKRVRYTWDPLDYDAFQSSLKTLALHSGDCFVKGTKVLTDRHQLVSIESLRVGDKIWGLDKWSTVTNTWEKGTLKTWNIRLNNGSSMRLTPDHKVWVADCEKHGGRKSRPCSCSVKDRKVHRITVKELKKNHVLIQPDRIPFGMGEMDSRRALIEGLYLSDGSSAHPTSFEIAGQDGCPKEAQKREVETICTALGIPTKWQRKYISIKDKAWTQRLKTMGTHAPNKHALSIDLSEGPALNLLRGILADSGKNTHGSGSTFTTTSRELWLQTRVLLKMAGLTASERYIEDHGGLGKNPIWRLGIRGKREAAPKLLRVKEIIRDEVELPCFDIETDDHMVWLPEADWTTSQCDDYATLLGAMLRSVGIKVRSRVVQT